MKYATLCSVEVREQPEVMVLFCSLGWNLNCQLWLRVPLPDPPSHLEGRASVVLLFYVYGCFTCMYVCVACVCLVPLETKKGSEISWD